MASAAELEAILCDLHAKARENMDKLPVEEKKKLLEVFQTVAERTEAIQKDLKQSVNSTDHEGKVLKMCGQLPRDISGSIMVPTKEDLTVAVGSVLQYRNVQAPMTVSVESHCVIPINPQGKQIGRPSLFFLATSSPGPQ